MPKTTPDTVSGPSRFSPDARVVLFCAVLAFAVSFGTFLCDYSGWNQPHLKVGDEFILGTHDAYYWLAGAKEVGRATGSPMSQLAAFLSEVTGAPLGLVGFWSPAFAGALVGVVMAVWAWLLGAAEAGALLGVLAVYTPGFYFRVRLGYYDTDMVTLLFPLLMGLLMAGWLKGQIRPYPWLGRVLSLFGRVNAREGSSEKKKSRKVTKTKKRAKSEEREEIPDVSGPVLTRWNSLWVMFAAGLLARFSNDWHGYMAVYAKGLFFLTLVLVFVLGKRQLRGRLLWGVVVFVLTAFNGWPGAVLAAAVIWVEKVRPAWSLPVFRGRTELALPLAVILAGSLTGDVFGILFSKLAFFLKSYSREAAQEAEKAVRGTDIAYPSIAQSVIEAQIPPLEQILQKMHPWTFLVWIGGAGFLAVCLFQPLALFLAPFFGLACLAPSYGIRLTMFAAPVLAVGLGVPSGFAARGIFAGKKRAAPLAVAASLLILGLLAWPQYTVYTSMPPTPIMTKQHAEALITMRDRAPGGSYFWTWWDWGYATQYYAERDSFADGARHTGEWLFPLGRVLATPSPMQANQLIRYTAMRGNDPEFLWKGRGAEEIDGFLQTLAAKPMVFEGEEQTQYVVVCDENYPLMSWINFYGTWDLASRSGTQGQVTLLAQAFSVNFDQGLLQDKRNGQTAQVRTIDTLTAEGRQFLDFPRNMGGHLLLNKASQRYVLMGGQVYSSLAVQLMLARPDNPAVTPFFRLVYEGFPYVRIWEVVKPRSK